MARDEIAGRRKRGAGSRPLPTGKDVTRERARDRESATGRAGGTGRFVAPKEKEVPRKSPGTARDRNHFDGGGI